MCRLSRNSGASTSGNPKNLSRPVAGKFFFYIFPTNFRKSLKYKISPKLFQWEPSCSVQRRTDGHQEAKTGFSQICEGTWKPDIRPSWRYCPTDAHTIVTFLTICWLEFLQSLELERCGGGGVLSSLCSKRATECMDRSLKSGRCVFSHPHTCPEKPWGHPVCTTMGIGPFSGSKRPESVVVHSPPSIDEVGSRWSYKSISALCLYGV
jgi:hypothetical protein